MANFVLLYTGGGMAETQAERDASMQRWGAWLGGLGDTLIDGGNPFTPDVKTLTSDGNINNGVAGKQATGYSIVKADSLEAAVLIAKDCPQLKEGGDISVYETFPVM